jgi:hypothetical protein
MVRGEAGDGQFGFLSIFVMRSLTDGFTGTRDVGGDTFPSFVRYVS